MLGWAATTATVAGKGVRAVFYFDCSVSIDAGEEGSVVPGLGTVWGIVCAVVAAACLWACVPPGAGAGGGRTKDVEPITKSYSFFDGETFVRSQIDATKYRRIAVLYVGLSYSSQSVESDQGGTGQEEGASGRDASAVAKIDRLLYSNALSTAFAKRGAQLVERNKINSLVYEQRLANNELMDLSDKEKAQRLGMLLKADLLIQGTVFVEEGGFRTSANRGSPFFSDTTGMTVHAIDAATGEVVWLNTTMARRYVSSQDLLKDPSKQVSEATMIGELAEKMVSTFYK